MNDADLLGADAFATLSAHPIALCAVIGTLAFMESLAIIGIFTPGIALLATGALAAGAAATPLSWLLAAGWFGAALGDGLSFLLGRRIGPGVRDPARYPRLTAWMRPGERLIDRYGVLALVIGRFLGPIRPVLPLAAGMLRMPTPRFMTLNVVTAIAWSPAYLLPGYLVGAAYGQRITVPSDWPWALLLALLIIGFALRTGTLTRRLGKSDGALARRLRDGQGLGARAVRPWPGTEDTPLAQALSTGATLLALAIPSALVFASDAGAPWRSFAGALLRMLRALW